MADKTDGEIANETSQLQINPSLRAYPAYPANIAVLWLSRPRTYSVVTVVHKIVMLVLRE